MMVSDVLTDLKDEQLILKKILSLIEKRQKFMYDFEMSDLGDKKFYKLLNEQILNELEEQRTQLLMKLLCISRNQAMEMRLSSVEKNIKNNEVKLNHKKFSELNELNKIFDELYTNGRQ